jgi:hypothetical protein
MSEREPHAARHWNNVGKLIMTTDIGEAASGLFSAFKS